MMYSPFVAIWSFKIFGCIYFNSKFNESAYIMQVLFTKKTSVIHLFFKSLKISHLCNYIQCFQRRSNELFLYLKVILS